MSLTPSILTGRYLTLTPTTLEDAESLFPKSDPETYRLFPAQPLKWNSDGMRAYVKLQLAMPGRIMYTARRGDEVVATSSMYDYSETHRGLEIGYTCILPEHRGTAVNPEMKFIMFRHAIEDLDCIRVQLKTDARNLRSQAAMRKLGLVYEGTLRNHMISQNAYQRDTVFFSMIASEWPAMRERLIERLGYEP